LNFFLSIKSYSQSYQVKSAIITNDSSLFLQKVKLSGFIQSQFQIVETNGATTISGGDFEPNTNNRFILRRGRLKASFNSKNAEYVFQINATEKGIEVDEIYVALSVPYLKTFTFTTGIFDRPLGYEIGYSSSMLESAERSRVMKSLCPDEKDLGAMLSVQTPESSVLHFITLNAGLFNGTSSFHRDFDNRKDIIAHLFINQSAFSDLINYRLGISIESGGFDNQSKEHFVWNNGFKMESNDTLAKAIRSFKGIDVECSINWLFGKTQLRGEYLFGIQSGTFLSNKTPVVAPNMAAYNRNFTGGYLLFLHNLPNNKIQLVAKYDWLDPNSKIVGTQIGLLPNTGKADICFRTIGLGFNYYCNKNLKFLAWYEIINNEITQLAGYSFDIKDNLFTLRIQYKF
jgi:hypothetical protein